MSNDQYLQGILATQDLTDAEEDALRHLREKIESQIGQLAGEPRFYYGGSYGKRTIIREKYDLDIVAYWPRGSQYSVEGISDAVGKQLQKYWEVVRAKTVSWELPFQNGFHIDVVPGRAIDSGFREANLYRRDTKTTLKTSIKDHIDAVRASGRRDVIRLVKLWRARHGLSCKTFWLELMIIDGCWGVSSGLERQLNASLVYLRDHSLDARVEDPANGNNVISDDVPPSARLAVARAAQAAIDARSWAEVFGE